MKTIVLFILLLFPFKLWALQPDCALDFGRVAERALQKNKLTFDHYDLLKSKMKKAAWLPTLSVGYDRAIRQTDSIDYNDNVSVSSGGVFIGPEDSNQTTAINQGDVLRLRALWNLNQLVFPDSTIAVQNLERNLFHDRQALIEDLYKLFQERAKLKSHLNKLSDADRKEAIERVSVINQRLSFESGLCRGAQ